MSEPLESAHLANALLKIRNAPAHGDIICLVVPEARALYAEIERLREFEKDQIARNREALREFASGYPRASEAEIDMLTKLYAELRARPTREQALRALESWASRPPGWASPEDCLDAAMREPERPDMSENA